MPYQPFCRIEYGNLGSGSAYVHSDKHGSRIHIGLFRFQCLDKGPQRPIVRRFHPGLQAIFDNFAVHEIDLRPAFIFNVDEHGRFVIAGFSHVLDCLGIVVPAKLDLVGPGNGNALFKSDSTICKTIGSFMACAIVKPVTAQTAFIEELRIAFRQTMEWILFVRLVGSPHAVRIFAMASASPVEAGSSSCNKWGDDETAYGHGPVLRGCSPN